MLTHEDRRVTLGVARCFTVAQRQHQVHEVRGLVALERGHELLVVDAERVGRVIVDRRELCADADVLVHGPLSRLRREGVPGAHLHEWVNDQIGRALRHHPARAPRLRVFRRLRGGEIGVGRLEPASEWGCVQRRSQLAEIVVALCDLPEEEVTVGPHSADRVRAERVHPGGPVLDDLHERVLAGCSLLDG